MTQSLTEANSSARQPGRRFSLWAAPLVALSLGACGVDREATGSIRSAAADYTQTHPIQLAEMPVTLNIFPGAGKMDRATSLRLKEFAENHRAQGVGQIEVLFPAGAIESARLHAALPEIRAALASGGAKGSLSVGEYPARPGGEASPIKLAYRALKARAGNHCGEWPDDLASASSLQGWQNRPYWNFGCAYQSAFANQVADPRDFEAPRAEAPVDVEMRRRAIEKVRQGADPGSSWKTTLEGVGG